MATYTEECGVTRNDGSYAELASLTEEIDKMTIAVTDTLAYKTYGKTYAFNQCNIGNSAAYTRWRYEDIDLSVAQENGNSIRFSFNERIQIPDFAWTDNDSEKIKTGQPVTNLTAAALNDLYQKIKKANNFMYLREIPTVKSGDTITADAIRPACSAIREGARRVDKYMFGTATSCYIAIKAGAPILASTLLTMRDVANRVFRELRP